MDVPRNAHVLLVEDHEILSETVGIFLENAGFCVDYARDGLSALHLGTVNRYDAVVLDIMLPGLDGFEICRRWRQDGGLTMPVLMLTARDELGDRLQGFDCGADDYLVKPFDLPELAARLTALIRRNRGEVSRTLLRWADLELDLKRQEARRQGKRLKLTPFGFRILHILMREAPNVVPRADLIAEVWGEDPPDTDALRSHFYQLRQAVDKPFGSAMIRTLPGVGYQLQEGGSDTVG
ncbi:response regulator transcription factor [Hahella sp. SMD15-11]|uniref:Response regulator transcription factor n=1 Tax=Thermohahella caldifontis TaxID=3142973 RepID=A0AB39UTI1_9GAMM